MGPAQLARFSQPGWLGVRELDFTGSAAERLALLMQEGSLLGRYVSLLCARRAAAGPTGAVTARGWAHQGPEGDHSLRPCTYRLAGHSALALASRHLSPWRGPPTSADAAFLAGLNRRRPRRAPVDVLVASAALGGRHALLVVVDDGELPMPRVEVAPFLALVRACAAGWAAGPPASAPIAWREVAEAAALAASWAADSRPPAPGGEVSAI